MFVFPVNSFSGESALALNSYKNNLASSWLYFNKSLEIVKEINNLCENNNFTSIPAKTNELSFFIQKAFDFLDKANLDSFSFILLEKSFLEEQKIELIPEEQLFDDFILFNQNLNELSTPDTQKTSDSYVSLYFKTSNKFNEFSSKAGFYSLYLNEFSGTDLLGFYSKDSLNLVKSKEFYVPLLKKTVSSVLLFILGFDDLDRSLEILRKMPSNELFALFGDFASAENSVALNFSELVSNTALHKQTLKERNTKLSSNIESNIVEIDVKLNSLAFSSLSKFDSNILGFLFENLESTSISEKTHNIYSIEFFVSESKQKLFLLKGQFNELKKKEYFNEVSLAETTNSLKKINLELISLNEDVDFYSVDLFNELTVLCDAKTEILEKELNEIDFSSKSWVITSLGSKTAVKISEYKKLEGEEKLFSCKEIISSFKEFSLALNQQEKFLLQSNNSLEACLNSLEEIFYSKNLSVFVDSFYSLKSLKENNLDLVYLSASCSELKERVKKYLYSNDEEIKEINFLYSDSKEILSKLVFLEQLYPEFFSSSKVGSFEEKINEISQHFNSNQLEFEFFKDSPQELLVLKELNTEMNDFFLSSFEEFLSANSELKLVPLEEPLLGKTFLARQKVFFPNPLNQTINASFSLVSPLISGSVFSSACVEEIVAENSNSRILVSCIPVNGLFVESDLNYSIPFSVSSGLVEATQNKLVFKDLIEFDSPFFISRVKAVIPLDFAPDFAFVLFDSEKIPVQLDSKKAIFYLNDLKPVSKAELFYSVPEPISVFLSEKSRTQLDENTFFTEFLVETKNNLAFNFDSVKISVPLMDFDLLQDIQLFDSVSKVSFSKINGAIVFPVSLDKFESKEFILKFRLTDFKGYFDKLKESILSDLVFLSNSSDQEISSEAIELLNKADSVSELSFLLELRQKTDFLLLKENNSVETEFNLIKNLVEEKISSLEKSIEFLDSIGFAFESNELKSRLTKEKSNLINSLSLPKEESLPLLLAINSSLEEFSDTKTESFLLDKRDFLIKKTKETSKELSLLKDQNLSFLEKEIFEQDNNFFSLFSRKDYFNAGLSLKSIEEKTSLLFALLEKKINSKKNYLKEKTVFLEEKKNLIAELFFNTGNALSESDLYLPPITEKRLFFLKDSLEKLNFDLFNDVNSLEELLLQEQKVINLEKQINEIEEELSFSLNKMKEDAKVFLLSAKLSKKPAEIISQAEELFNKGKYIDSINLSFGSQNSSPVAFALLSNFDLPLQIFPLFGLIFFILAKKFLFKKKQKKRKPKTRISGYSI